MRAAGIADEGAVGVAPDDLEDGGGPGGSLARANLDGESDQLGWQAVGTVAGRAPAAARDPGRLPSGARRRRGSGLAVRRVGSGGVFGEVALEGVQQDLAGPG